jgi:excisionase family DNA binding protein
MPVLKTQLSDESLKFFENYIDKNELAKKLSVSISYINKLMKLHRIRFVKFGRAVRFKYSDVVADLQKRSSVS